MDNKKRFSPFDIVMIVVPLIAAILLKTACAPCGPKDDGSWMSCHYAGLAVFVIALVIFVLNIVHMLVQNGKVRMAADVINIILAIIAIIIPGHIIHMCLMDTMRCWAVMRPCDIIFMIVIIILSVIGILTDRKKAGRR